MVPIEQYYANLQRINKYFLSNGSKDLSELARLRGWGEDSQKELDFLVDYGVRWVSSDFDYEPLKQFEDYGLFSESGYFLMSERFVIPIKDLLGNVISWTGWYPDDRKYITVGTKLFSRPLLLFGLEQLPCEGYLVVCEGIFDALRMRGIEIPAVSLMGVDMSMVQRRLCNLSNGVIMIPDNDKIGRKVIREDAWRVGQNGKYLSWKGLDSGMEGVLIKDLDMLNNVFDKESVKAIIAEGKKSSAKKVVNIV